MWMTLLMADSESSNGKPKERAVICKKTGCMAISKSDSQRYELCFKDVKIKRVQKVV